MSTHRPGTLHVPPEQGTRGYIRVVARGCGGYKFETLDGVEYDCRHRYTWSCDECPIVIEKYAPKEEQNAPQHQTG